MTTRDPLKDERRRLARLILDRMPAPGGRTWDITPASPGYSGPAITLHERPAGGVMVALADDPRAEPWVLLPVSLLQYIDAQCIRDAGDRDAARAHNDALDAAFPEGLPGGCGGYFEEQPGD
jgi:hypothetical protein